MSSIAQVGIVEAVADGFRHDRPSSDCSRIEAIGDRATGHVTVSDDPYNLAILLDENAPYFFVSHCLADVREGYIRADAF